MSYLDDNSIAEAFLLGSGKVARISLRLSPISQRLKRIQWRAGGWQAI